MRKSLLLLGVLLMMSVLLTGCGPAAKYDKAGMESLATGDYEKAAADFLAAVTNNPDRAEYYIHYGAALTALGRYEEAVSQFDRAYTDKDMLIVYQNNKKALRGKGIVYFHQKQYDKALEALNDSLSIHTLSELDKDILLYKAACLKLTGSYEEAVDTYDRIISEDNEDAAVYAERAACYYELGDYEKSIADFDSAILHAPNHYEYYFGKYYLMTAKGDKSGATAVLEEAKKIQVVSPEDRYQTAILQYLVGDYDTALAKLNESLAEGFTGSNYYIGEIYRNKKDYEQAVFCYENYIAGGDASIPGVYNQIAVCLNKMGRNEEALNFLEQGKSKSNSDTHRILLKNEIITYEYMGDFEKAHKKTLEYLALYPQDQKAHKEADFIATRLITADSGEQ